MANLFQCNGNSCNGNSSGGNVTIDGVEVEGRVEFITSQQLVDCSVSTLPCTFSNGSAVVLNGEIHILGGYDYYKYHYKWNGSSWTKVSTLPYEFTDGSAVVLNGEIHIMGVNDSTSAKNHFVIATPAYYIRSW